MKEGTYKILITVYEANDLQPRAEVLFFNPEKSACDAFIEIEVRGITKKTNVSIGACRLGREQIILYFKNHLTLHLKKCLYMILIEKRLSLESMIKTYFLYEIH